MMLSFLKRLLRPRRRMRYFNGQRVTVAGLGIHGGAVGNIRWLHEQGAILTVTDIKSAEELAASVEELADLKDITWVLGEHRLADFTDTDMVVRNPALRRDNEFLNAARAAHVPIEMDSSLFFRYSPTKHVIGVTGSKGKTTTTHAIATLMNLRFAHVETIGVEGSSPLAALPRLTADDLAVFELSSWRLEALDEHKISPPVAVMVSLYRDHLNTYDSFDAYAETKKSIVKHQVVHDMALLNYDDPSVRAWNDGPLIQARVAWYTLGHKLPGDGVYVERGTIVCKQGHHSGSVFALSALPTQSEHEQRNLLPAIYLAWLHKVRPEDMLRQLTNLPRLSHRLEPIGDAREVTYINDSAATIPEATIAALNSFKNRPIVLILGGSDKELEFTNLAQAVAKANIRALVFLPGNATEYQLDHIKSAYGSPPPIHHVTSMDEAVAKASTEAQAGDIVLLSPGATSFGLFAHEFDRGDQFKRAVAQLSVPVA
ncbi:UDP-N-acetylmuramoyl-L-alanine--D-glutamate ligase [Candidatus Woesearchaeota archaeon]|nr:UDP-N-acetylmuramoyl-L-alanine--D-glutamate ligase [Candidatus Woesearchaeota archaeon]